VRRSGQWFSVQKKGFLRRVQPGQTVVLTADQLIYNCSPLRRSARLRSLLSEQRLLRPTHKEMNHKDTSNAPLHTEAALLLYCARRRVNEAEDAALHNLTGQVKDWEYLLRTAQRHGLMPFLYRQLKALGSESVPDEALSRLRDLFFNNAARNLLLTEELHKILALFEEQGIEALPYKGPALALQLYGDTGFRQFDDLDLIIRRQDIAAASALLLSAGYQTPYAIKTRARQAAYLESQRQQLFVSQSGNVCLEIHWGFAPKSLVPMLDAEHFWGRLAPYRLERTQTRSLAPEDLLIVLCVHGGKHLWERLSWVCDVAELLASHPAMDWDGVVREASALGVRRMLLLGLFLARDLLETDLPEAILRALEDDRIVPSLAGQVKLNLLTDGFPATSPTASILFNYRMRERRLDGARYCYHITTRPTPAEWASLDLPDTLSFLYYLVRPFRMIRRHAPPPFKRPAGF
jgi:hypothetical protein